MLAERIIELRGDKSVSTAALEAKITPSVWYSLERGEKIPHRKNVIKLAQYFGVSADELLTMREKDLDKIKRDKYASPYKRNCFAFDADKKRCLALEHIACDGCKFYKTPAQISIEKRATDRRLAKLPVMEQERIRAKYSEVE